MYSLDHGRPTWPSSLLSGILLLQYFDEVGDEHEPDSAGLEVCPDTLPEMVSI
jgi:hypothetical protein